MAIRSERDTGATLVDVIDRILDKGLVIDADITVSIAGVELLGIKIRAALSSFETAARYGLEFPSGTDMETAAWKEAQIAKENCPQCDKRVPIEDSDGEAAMFCRQCWKLYWSQEANLKEERQGHHVFGPIEEFDITWES